MKKGVKLVLGVLAAGLFAAPALGQVTGESCAAIAGDAQRLACYDTIFRGGGTEQPELLLFQSEQLIPARPSGRERATFQLACLDGAPDVRFVFAGQQMSATGDIAALTLQVDQGATQVRTMQAAEDNRSLRFGTVSETNAFLDTLVGGDTLKVRATPVRQRSLNVTFDLELALPQITALRLACAQPR